MTTETKIPFDKEYISSFSKEIGEPEWLTEFRFNALELAENLPLPKPDKTKIENGILLNFKNIQLKVKISLLLTDLPDEVKAVIRCK